MRKIAIQNIRSRQNLSSKNLNIDALGFLSNSLRGGNENLSIFGACA